MASTKSYWISLKLVTSLLGCAITGPAHNISSLRMDLSTLLWWLLVAYLLVQIIRFALADGDLQLMWTEKFGKKTCKCTKTSAPGGKGDYRDTILTRNHWYIPVSTNLNDNAIITPKLHRDVGLTQWWRYYHIMCPLLYYFSSPNNCFSVHLSDVLIIKVGFPIP